MSQVSPTSDLKQARATYSVRVLEARMITPTIRAIRVEKPADFVFRASQAARIFLPAPHDLEPHPISMASAPTRDYLEFAVRRSESAWKQSYFALREGNTLQIQGPVARFFLDTLHPAILIAGGVGITPFKGMLEYATDARLPITLDLLYSSRVPEEIAYKNELDSLAQENPCIRIHYTLTRSTHTHGWNGRVGRIDTAWLGQVMADKPEALFYGCGTPQMLADVAQMLESLGVAPERILSESFKGYARYAPHSAHTSLQVKSTWTNLTIQK